MPQCTDHFDIAHKVVALSVVKKKRGQEKRMSATPKTLKTKSQPTAMKMLYPDSARSSDHIGIALDLIATSVRSAEVSRGGGPLAHQKYLSL